MRKSNLVLLTVFSMVLVSFSCLFISQSYSYILGSSASNNNQVISTGNLDSTITEVVLDSDISALSDQEGLSQDSYGQIDIAKDNQYSVYYSINLSYATSNLQQGETTQNLLPLEFIKVALFEINDGTLSANPIVGPVTVADLPINTADTTNVFNDNYFLTFGTFDSGVDSASYALKVWADEDTSEDYSDYLVYLSLSVYQEPLISKQVYNLNGKVYNDTLPVEGAIVELQNGTVIATTLSDGSYSLNGVPEGTYNLKITSGSTVRETTIHVSGSYSSSVVSTTPTDGASGSYLQNSAYTYYTTPYKILNSNTLSTTTCESTSSSYTIPKSYLITGTQAVDTVNINNLKIDINASELISIGS